jgi:AsmA protein
MAAPHLPFKPDATSQKTDPTGTSEASTKQPTLVVVRSTSKAGALQERLRSAMKKRWFRIVGVAVAVLIALLIALPFLINVNSFRPRIESEASAALGRQVTISNLSLSILSGGVRADGIAIADDPAFSKSPFVTAKSLNVGVELMPLIFSKQLNVTDITLEAPQITLLKAANGKWNFSTIGGTSEPKSSEPSKSGGSAPTNFSVAKLKVNRGKLLVARSKSSKPVVYDNVNISVKNFSLASEFPFQLTAQLPAGGDANISGKAGPINAGDTPKTPLTTSVKINNMSIGALGIIDPASGIAGIASFDGTLNSDGKQAKAVGLFTGKQLKFSSKGTPAPKTVTIKHAVNVDLEKQSGTITQGDVTIGSALAHLTGTFQSRGETEIVNLKLNAPNMSVDELQAMLPSVGVVFPSGSQLKGGTLSADLTIAGPLDKLVITGPVRLSNTELANFDLGSKLGALAAFAGKSVSNPNTSIQNASLDARAAPEGMKADNINLNLPAIGVITGAGTVSPSGELAFKMLADLHGGMVGGLSKVAGTTSGKGGVPFAIEGTESNPKFIPDVGGVVGGVATGAISNVAKGKVPGADSVTKGLGGVLGKKKN